MTSIATGGSNAVGSSLRLASVYSNHEHMRAHAKPPCGFAQSVAQRAQTGPAEFHTTHTYPDTTIQGRAGGSDQASLSLVPRASKQQCNQPLFWAAQSAPIFGRNQRAPPSTKFGRTLCACLPVHSPSSLLSPASPVLNTVGVEG